VNCRRWSGLLTGPRAGLFMAINVPFIRVTRSTVQDYPVIDPAGRVDALQADRNYGRSRITLRSGRALILLRQCLARQDAVPVLV